MSDAAKRLMATPNTGNACSAGSRFTSNPARPSLPAKTPLYRRSSMARKLNASLLALTGLLIALGAFGHSFMGGRTRREPRPGGCAVDRHFLYADRRARTRLHARTFLERVRDSRRADRALFF